MAHPPVLSFDFVEGEWKLPCDPLHIFAIRLENGDGGEWYSYSSGWRKFIGVLKREWNNIRMIRSIRISTYKIYQKETLGNVAKPCTTVLYFRHPVHAE